MAGCFRDERQQKADMNSTGEKLISGNIEGVTLSSFLQMLEMEHKTCIVNVTAGAETGRIFFLNGTLIDAETPLF